MIDTPKKSEHGEFEPTAANSVLPSLVSISASPQENHPGDGFHVRVTVKFGEMELMGADNYYRIRLRTCQLIHTTIQCSVVPESEYRVMLQKPEYKSQAEERTVKETISSDGLTLSAEAGANPKPHAKAFFGINLGQAAKVNEKSESGRQTSHAVKLVEPMPRGWRVGDPNHGDPRHQHGCLDGPYFNETGSALCKVDLERRWTEASFTLGAVARMSDFKITVTDKFGDAQREGGKHDAEDMHRALREKVASLAFAKEFGQDLDQGEEALATARISAKRRAGRRRGSAATRRR